MVGTVCALIFFVWYPAPYFEAKGAWNALRVLLSVDLVVGPMLTLYLYRPRKPGLRIDMTFIAVVQLCALIFGTAVIYSERPYFVVFAVDRFEVLARRDVDLTSVTDPRLLDKPAAGPIAVVALKPETLEGMQRLLNDVIFDGKPDIERRPEFWAPYEDHRQVVLDKARPLEELTAESAATLAKAERLANLHGREVDELGFVPLRGRDRDFAVVIDRHDGSLLALIDADPWID